MLHVLTLVVESQEEPFEVLRKVSWVFQTAHKGGMLVLLRHDGTPEPNVSGWLALGFSVADAKEILEALEIRSGHPQGGGNS